MLQKEKTKKRIPSQNSRFIRKTVLHRQAL
jgi:hypothetical protein